VKIQWEIKSDSLKVLADQIYIKITKSQPMWVAKHLWWDKVLQQQWIDILKHKQEIIKLFRLNNMWAKIHKLQKMLKYIQINDE